MQTLLRRSQEALQHSRAAVARLHALGDDARACHPYYREMIALPALDRTEETLTCSRLARTAGR